MATALFLTTLVAPFGVLIWFMYRHRRVERIVDWLFSSREGEER